MSLDFAPGSSFGQGRYEIHRELGRGGMGRVLLAYAHHLERYVVVKVLQGGQNEQTLARFGREAQALAQARHRYVVPVHEFGVEGNCPFIVMGFVEGETLEAYVSRMFREGETLELDWIRDFFLKLVEALQSLHEHGIVHRDVKPANILISKETGDPVLVDFGLAKIDQSQFRATLESLTQTGQLLGTPGFMPPEQLDTRSGLGESGAGSDVWGFGATLFYAMSGRQPFQGRTLIELAAALMSLDAPRLRSLHAETPLWLDELCHQCLRRAVVERPTTEAIYDCLNSSGKIGLTRKRSTKKAVFAFLFVSLLMILGFLWQQNQDSSPPNLELKETRTSIYTNQRVFELTGRVVDAHPSHLLINGKRVELGRAGLFQKSFKLLDGSQVVRLVAVDQGGKESEVRELTVVLDRQLPEITVDPIRYVKDGTVFIEGKADKPLLSASYLSQPCNLDGNRFSIKLNLRNYQRDAVLSVRDLAGNEVTVKLPFSVAGQTESGSFGSISSAFRKAESGDTIFLMPGRYKMPGKPTVSSKIIGVGRRENIILYAKDRPFLDLKKLSVAFENLTVRQRSRSGSGIVAKSGQIHFVNCVVELEGVKNILITGDKSKVLFSATNTQLRLFGREGSKFSKARVFMKNVDVRDCRQLLVQGDNLELISMFDCDQFYWSRVNLHRSRAGGVLSVRSYGEMENCKIHHCNKIGLVLNGGEVRLRGTHIYANRYAGLAVGHRGMAEAVACRFQRNGGSVDYRIAGIHVYDRSELKLVGCEVSDHSQYGIYAMDDGRVKLLGCVFKNNKPGDINSENQGLVERSD